jgi:hypothetical protein
LELQEMQKTRRQNQHEGHVNTATTNRTTDQQKKRTNSDIFFHFIFPHPNMAIFTVRNGKNSAPNSTARNSMNLHE